MRLGCLALHARRGAVAVVRLGLLHVAALFTRVGILS